MVRTYIFLVFCVLFWSGNFVVGRYIHESISPIELSFYRWGGVLLFVLPLLILSREKIWAALKSHFWILFALGGLGIAGFNTLLYIGLRHTTATNALIINSSIPILILLLSSLILKQHISKKRVSGILLSTLGVLYLILKGKLSNLFSLDFNIGDFWVLLSSLDWALYSVLLKFKPKHISIGDFFITTVFIGTLILLPFYLYSSALNFSREYHVISVNFLAILYVVIFPSFLSYFFWNKAILQIGAPKVGQFIHLMPLFGAILAYIFLGEHLKIYHVVGMALIGGGIYISLTKYR